MHIIEGDFVVCELFETMQFYLDAEVLPWAIKIQQNRMRPK